MSTPFVALDWTSHPSTALGITGMGPRMAFIIASLPVAFYLLYRAIFPTVDPREPPILRPRMPFFGHVFSMIREQTKMFDRLYKEKAMPICTLPMLNGKIYVINKPALIAAAFRNRAFSFEVFTLELAAATMGMTKRHVELFGRPGGMDEVVRVFHLSLSGDNLVRMNARALADIAVSLNAIPSRDSLDVPNAFEWLRDILSMATMKGLFGKNNPFSREDINLLWEFEKGVGLLAAAPAPNLFAPKALAARNQAQAKLRPFYVNHLDEGDDVSALMQDRAAMNRRLGIPDDEISIIEFSMPWVGTTNSVPTLFWLFAHVLTSPDLIARVRSEVQAVTAVTTDALGGRTAAAIDVAGLDKACPILLSCYRETLRLYSDQLGNRRVMADTTLRDPDSGHEYLLRKGVHVQWPSIVPHRLESVWGADASQFRPDRFVGTPSAEEEKLRQGANIPFGGGRHLCPGRNFARAEILGMVGALALGFEVEGARVPAAADPYLGTAMQRPEWEGQNPGLRVTRRIGWEDVRWSFLCGEKHEARGK